MPLHVWMPLTYSAAPIPAAAVLSGAAVKAGVIGLIRFLPFDTALPGWGEALAAVGLFSAFYGVAIGITQPNPKTVLAYSSVSQMGLLAACSAWGLPAGDDERALAAAFYATASHPGQRRAVPRDRCGAQNRARGAVAGAAAAGGGTGAWASAGCR